MTLKEHQWKESHWHIVLVIDQAPAPIVKAVSSDEETEQPLPSFKKKTPTSGARRWPPSQWYVHFFQAKFCFRARKEKPKKRSRTDESSDDDSTPLTPKEALHHAKLEQFDKLVDNMKTTRRAVAEEDVTGKSYSLKEDMIAAAEADVINFNNKRIAAAKFKMLPRVQAELSKWVQATAIFDNENWSFIQTGTSRNLSRLWNIRCAPYVAGTIRWRISDLCTS